MKKKRIALITSVITVIIVLLLSVFLIKGDQKKKQTVIEEELPVRQPAVAGTFYSADKEVLSNQIDSFLDKVDKSEKRPTILIVPHAGYQYSGQTAAYGFKQLIDSGVRRVILLGATHQVPFSGTAVYEKGFWQTPLGQVEIDAGLASKIIESNPLLFANQEYHEREHSLEVEAPFLQKVLKNFKIVPISMGSNNRELIDALVSILIKQLDSETVLIISSDFSHYPSYEDAKEIDGRTIEAILTGETANFDQTITQSMEAGIANLSTCACGEGPIRVAMKLAEKLGINDIRLIKYANSGDATGEKERIVGYAAIGFYQERLGNELNKEEQEELLIIARSALENYLKDKKIPDFEIEYPLLNQPSGTFVTLEKKGNLRGCIGQFEAMEPLWKIVRQKAIDAAVRDSRFSPVRFEELDEIKIEISVLSPQKKIDSWREIELGKHGVVIKKGFRGGVFLPQVATDNNWDLETFMGQLCSQKAGLSWDCWQKDDIDLYVFTAQVFEEEER